MKLTAAEIHEWDQRYAHGNKWLTSLTEQIGDDRKNGLTTPQSAHMFMHGLEHNGVDYMAVASLLFIALNRLYDSEKKCSD